MIRTPQGVTLTDTLFPYTTLFRSGGELGAEQAGAEDPDWDVQAFAGNGPDATSVFRRFEILHQLDDIARRSIGVAVEGAAERVGGRLVRAGRSTEAVIDAAGMERIERAELLGDKQRRMVRQHDAAGADADGGRAGGGMAEGHRRRRGGAGRNRIGR